jgi:hypothetical protein
MVAYGLPSEAIGDVARTQAWPRCSRGIAEPKKAEPKPASTGGGGEFDVASIRAKINAEQKANQPEQEPEAEPEPKASLPALVKPLPSEAPEWDEAILALNEQHAIIERVGGGKAVIASWEPSDRDPTRLVVVYQTKESFLLRYSNRFVSWEVPNLRGTKTVVVPLGQYWLGSRNRRQYRGVTFRPGGPQEINGPNGLLNLWQGWGVEARPDGDWGLIREHIEMVIAGGDKEFADYVIHN